MRVGDRVLQSGYATQAKYLRGCDPSVLEDRIGYRRGRLAGGWYLLFLLEIPGEDEFEFRGYSQMSGGVAQGHLSNPPDARNAEQHLLDGGYDVQRMKRNIVKDIFRLDTSDRLARVVAVRKAFGVDDYPCGLGIPQWDMRSEKPFLVKAFVQPGQLWQGDYTDHV